MELDVHKRRFPAESPERSDELPIPEDWGAAEDSSK
jgi:hypothetical protein